MNKCRKELIIAIVGLILVISMPNSIHGSTNKMWYLFGMRLLLGIGIGGDYPMSASIVSILCRRCRGIH